MTEFIVGTPVRKKSGYKWPGIIVAAFTNLKGDGRYVVECTVPEVEGALHIFSAEQLEYIQPIDVLLDTPEDEGTGITFHDATKMFGDIKHLYSNE